MQHHLFASQKAPRGQFGTRCNSESGSWQSKWVNYMVVKDAERDFVACNGYFHLSMVCMCLY